MMPTVKTLRFAFDSLGANDEGPESGRSIESQMAITNEVKLTCIQNNTGNLRLVSYEELTMTFYEVWFLQDFLHYH